MGSSTKKHKEKEKDRKKRRRSRSRERDYGHRKDKHKSTHPKSAYKEREKRKYPDHKRGSSDEDLTPPLSKDEAEFEGRSRESLKAQDAGLEEGELAIEPAKGGGESISVSETNKLRAKLGLKPLQVDSSIPGLGSEDGGEGATGKEESEPRPEVFVKTENMLQKKQVELLREKFAINREKRKIAAKLGQVKTLGDSDSDREDNVVSWVNKSRKIEDEKMKAEKRAKLLEEMDEEFGIGQLVEEEFSKLKKSYGIKDLKGLTISHHPDAFTEGKMVVLTLKDQEILATGEDVLENVNMIDEEKAIKNVENKTKKPDYVAYDEPEFDEFGILKKKNILAKYDEELQGPKSDSFKIGTSSMNREKELEIIRMKLKQQQQGVVTLEMPALKLASEYLTEEEMVKFKKPKKRVRKIRKRLKADDILTLGTSEGPGDHGSRTQGKKSAISANSVANDNTNGDINSQVQDMDIDEDAAEFSEIIGPEEDLTGVKIEEDRAEIELDLALQKARKLKLKESREADFNEIAQSLQDANARDASDGAAGKGNNIILNATAEFCRTLGEIPTYGMSGNRDEEADELMDYEKDVIEERKRLDLDPQTRGAWNEVDIDDQPAEIQSRENEPILEEEPDVSVGMAGALKLAMKKGYLENENKKLVSAPRPSQLQAQTYTIEEKFYEDDKFGRRDRYTGPIQDFKERDAYKPDVKLEYIDDSGRLLNPKEAFRYLSHKFHGKGPGKNKVDKRTKKLDQEGKLKQMSSTDTPLGTLRLLQDKQKELQTPFILLSGGSKALTQSGITKAK